MGPFKLMSQTGVIDINYREPTTGSLLQGPGADHGEPITGYREPITGSRLQGTGSRLQGLSGLSSGRTAFRCRLFAGDS